MSLLTCEWNKLVFANYIVPPEILEKYLPKQTQFDYFNGNCYVSIVGFQFKDVKLGGVKIPFHQDFEEINLRFYVRRFDGGSWRKGTVFLSEIASKTTLAAMANSLFHENYKTLPTKQKISEKENELRVEYYFQFDEDWQHIKVNAGTVPSPVEKNGESEFIIHRPWGYGKHNEKETNEYKISHPHWQTYQVNEYSIKVDFTKIFGSEFNILNSAVPQSVILAEGSHINAERRTLIGG